MTSRMHSMFSGLRLSTTVLTALLAATLFAATLLAGAPSASAQTVIFVNAAATGANNGTSWTDAYQTVQPALTAAQPGTQVWVAAGRYVGCITLKEGVALYGGLAGTEDPNTFDLATRNIAAHPTILDGNRAGSVVTAPTGATAACRIDGFTITNGKASDGGGLYVASASPTIANNSVIANLAGHGAGLYLSASSATIVNNWITRNAAWWGGGALSLDSDCAPTIANSTITANSAGSGGALYMETASPTIVNTIIAFNSSGIQSYTGVPVMRNNCVYGNGGHDYVHLTDPTGTDGNISVDPRIADAPCGGWHLAPDSPCVDAGDNAYATVALDLDGQPRIQPAGGTVDIGADESDGTTPPCPFTIVRVSPTGDDARDGSSWPLAKRTVQAAITAAATAGGEVWVQAGTYYERITLTPFVHVYGGFAGTESARDDRDWKTHVTTLDGQQQGSVVTATQLGYLISTLDGFTVTHGSANSGGGVYLSGSSPAITHNLITGNRTTSLTTSGSGGGIYADRYARPVISSNTIVANSAYLGGGLYLYSAPALVVGNTIQANFAGDRGGGLYLSMADATIASNAITDNTAAARGGGAYLDSSAEWISNDTIARNSAGADGGGLYLSGSLTTIANTIVAYNSSGIAYSSDSSSSSFWLRNNCVYGNTGYNYLNTTDPTGTNGNISVDPGLVGLGYGGWHIRPDSPCIDVGNNARVAFGADLDGQLRIQPAGGTVDIGADESDGSTPPPGPFTIVRVSPTGDDAQDGSSWPLAKRTVQAAIDAAAAIGGDVWVQAGTYFERITFKPYAHVYGGFAGTESARGERDWSANRTVLDGQRQGTVVSGSYLGLATCTLDGFAVTRGRAASGGGIALTDYSAPTITNNAIFDNSATGSGGGVFLRLSSPTILRNTIAANSAALKGGGCYMLSSAPTIAGNRIMGNWTVVDMPGNPPYGPGGGLYLDGSTPTIINNAIVGNSAGSGGGLYAWASYNSPLATISNNTFLANDAGSGAGMYLENVSAVITNTIVAYNRSGIGGWNWAPTFRNNCVYGNLGGNYSDTDPTGTSGNISVDPLLPDPLYGDYHLRPGSPCIDAGDNASAIGAADLDDQPRVLPAGGTVDIGADEFDGSLPPPGPYGVVFVSPLGNDGQDGSSWSRAKQTVQAGILAATALGGEVWVQAGTYYERIVLTPFAHVYGGFAGTETTRDQRDWHTNVATLDGQQLGTVVTGARSCGVLSTLDGFVVTHGKAQYGGGLHLSRSSPRVANCTITANTATSRGGGLYAGDSAAPVIADCAITGNTGTPYGGGLCSWSAAPTIARCTLISNTASIGGGAYSYSSTPTIANCAFACNRAQQGAGLTVSSSGTILNNSIAGNIASSSGGGLVLAGTPTAVNNIVAFNSSGVYKSGTGTPTFNNNCVFGNTTYNYSGLTDPTGTNGNLSANPLFVQNPDPNTPGATGDLHLQVASPCINTGNNADAWGTTDLDGFARLVGPAVDMGAYEFGAAFYGDLDHDGDIDAADLVLFANCFTGPGPDATTPSGCNPSDLDTDTDVDLTDFARLQTLAN
jgi:hypothetical protein